MDISKLFEGKGKSIYNKYDCLTYGGSTYGNISKSLKLGINMKVKDDKILYASENRISDAIDFEIGDGEKGGIITLSTDVNAVPLSENKLVNWVKQKYASLKNRFTKSGMTDKIAKKHDLIGWTIGNFLDGHYRAKDGSDFNERSISVEIVSIDFDTLMSVAEDLCRDFKQQSVLVKSYDTGHIYFVNPEKVEKEK